MTAAATASDYEPVLLILALIVFVFVRRTYAMIRGMRLSVGRLVGYGIVYTGLFVLTIALSAGSTPWYYFVVDAALLAVAALLAASYVREHVVLERRPPDGAWYYRLHPWIPITYILLFVVRVGISLAVLGPDAFDLGPTTSTALTSGEVLLLQVVDALFAISTGFLVGRSAGVYLAYRRRLAGEAAAPPAPPAPPPAGTPLR